MPRIAAVTGKPDVPAAHHAVVDQVVQVFGGVRGPFSMLLHSPRLAERMLGLVTFFRDESIVEGRLRSVAILAAVREREAAYVWAAQVAAARRNGVPESTINLLRAKGDPGRSPPRRRVSSSIRGSSCARTGWIRGSSTPSRSATAPSGWSSSPRPRTTSPSCAEW